MSKLKTKCHSCKKEKAVLIKTQMRIFAKDKSRTEHDTHWLCEECNLKVIGFIKRDFLDNE